MSTLMDLPRYVAALMGEGGASFLAVTHEGTGDFLQLSPIPGENGVELDFPLITDRQIGNLPRIKTIGKALGLTAREAIGGDGDDFIDFDITGTPVAVAAVVSEFFQKLYAATPETPVSFEHDGFEA